MADDEEERRELERELAAELANLTAEDVGLDALDRQEEVGDTRGQQEASYVRLDLEVVLQQATQASIEGYGASSDRVRSVGSDEDASKAAASSWELLMQSVARNDLEFFQLVREDLREVRSLLLDTKEHQPKPEEGGMAVESQQIDLPQSDEKEEPLEEEQNRPNGPLPEDPAVPAASFASDSAIPVERSDSEQSKPSSQSRSSPSQCSPHPEPPGSPTPVEKTLEIDTSSPEALLEVSRLQAELEAIAKQHEVREARRLKVQAQRQKAREDAADLLRALQEGFEEQERSLAAARCETRERSSMSNEELRSRRHAAFDRESRESALMAAGDEDSRCFEAHLARIQTAIALELAQMAAEEQAERRRMRIEWQIRSQEQLCRTRGRFASVLMELVDRHDAQLQLRDRESKRERREGVQMRAEEAQQRRAIAEARAFHDQQERERNRSIMTTEDELARALEAERRLQKEQERCCSCMEQEEARCRRVWTYLDALSREEALARGCLEQEEQRSRCAWIYLEELALELAQEQERRRETRRLRWLDGVSTGFRTLERLCGRHEVANALGRWKHWHFQCLEDEKRQAMAAEEASRRLQTWYRLWHHSRQLTLESQSEANQTAARRVQSTFRGFYVRRKFANALALAQAVGEGDEVDRFDAVDLEDLIQLPPELVDGWEDPVLPASSVARPQPPPPLQSPVEEEEDEVPEAEDGPEEDERTQSESTNTSADSNPRDDPPKEQNLAATLWNKMRRVKQRQQHVQQERQRQQDPTYRVQKLLHRKPSESQTAKGGNQNSHHSQQPQAGAPKAGNTVTWSSTSNVKKRPKVKLPSLVERLRKQTMAER
ncbi:hypothetical protein BBJ28_00003925 [Nothophytophthora sp. Chile5]|nr:hypothetical protein BBJ28_00003925 [Nothophytophthora sp. Chile5]